MRMSDWSSDVCSSDLAARIIAHCGQHGKYHHHAETDGAWSRNDLRYTREIDHGRHQYHHKHVQHGPLPDEFDQFVKPCALKLDDVDWPTVFYHKHHQCQSFGDGHDDHEIGRASCRERVCQYV